jgi:hypothetical protein
MSSPRRRRAPARSNQRRRPAPARDFWGTESTEDNWGTVIRPSDHVTALVQSLGAPPFLGGEIAQHYFDAVYERAAALALALATAADLTATSEPTENAD